MIPGTESSATLGNCYKRATWSQVIGRLFRVKETPRGVRAMGRTSSCQDSQPNCRRSPRRIQTCRALCVMRARDAPDVLSYQVV